MKRFPSRCLAAATFLTLISAGPPTRSTTPDAVVDVSLAVGYQGQADIVVDPADPDALVVVGADDRGTGPTAWSSVNGGASFSATALPLTYDAHTFAEGAEATVAIDRNGIWYAAYEVHDLNLGSPIDSSLAVARSLDGLVWEAFALVVDNRGVGAEPSVETPDVAVDPLPGGCTSYGGRLQLVWVRKSGTDRAIYRSYSSTGGSTWATPAKINDGTSGAEDVWRPRAVIGPQGIVYAAWLDDLQKTIVVDRSTNGGVGFGPDVNAATVTLGCGAGDCGDDLGCSGGALHGSTPALAVDTSWTSRRGTVYVAFADEPGSDGLDVLVTSSADGGANWSTPVQIPSDATRQQYGPALAVHPTDGSVHALWYDRRADSAGPDCETETWHALSTDGGAAWTDETVISTAPSDYSGDPRGEGAHTALAAAGGRVYAVWTDKTGTDHEIALARIAHAGGTLVRGGHIGGDTTWSAVDGPFIVTGDQTIDAGVTLTIEAGAEVRFAACDDTNTGLDGNRIEVIVEGTLDLAGTSGNEVLLQSGSPTPHKADWYGLRFQNTTDSSDSTLTFATIRHAEYGMRLSGSSPTLTDATIELASVSGIEGSARSGVPFSPTRVTVDDAGVGVNLSGGVSGTWTDVTIENGTGHGGTISGGSLDLRLVGMSVLDNAGGGLITSLSGGTLEVILSEFNGNGAAGAGLTVNGTGTRTLVANDYENNAGDGLELNDDSSVWPSAPVYYSNFIGNGAMAVRMEPGSLPADARRNHWGALDAEMGSYPADVSGIWDIHDDAALRHVDFRENQASALANDLDLQSYLAIPAAINDNETVIYGGAVARGGILKVEVSTDGGSTWADATVDGAAFSYPWAPTPGVYTVMSRVTDGLGALESVPDQQVVTVSAGPTLSGTLLADETWSGGPIVLEGDVVVPAGVTLTIDPGTTVYARYLTDSTYGGLDPSRIEIIVQGVLASNGMPGNEVVWDSSRVTSGAQKGDWYGIRYLDTTTDALSIVRSTDLAHGVNGIKLENAAPDVIDSTIADCSGDGLSGTSGALAKPLWTLDGNSIQNNDGDGVDVTGGTQVRVLGATVTGNGQRGLSINANTHVVTVTDATISANGTTGLWVGSGGTGFRLLDSTIDGNGGDGVFVSVGGTEMRLERLTVSNNGLNGIEVANGTTLVLLKSTISGNERGLRVGTPRLVAAYDSITDNDGNLTSGYMGAGIYVDAGTGAPGSIGMSDIDSPVDYEAYLASPRALEARRNYWGATTTTNMNGAGFPADLVEFRDINDEGSVGVLDYDNWAPASVSGSAPGDEAAHITWPGDSATLNVTSVVVTGVAYARDGIDRVEVCARQAGDPACGDGAGNTPFGVVTGKEAWTFDWFPAASGTWFLQVRVVDDNQVKSTPAETIGYDVNLLGAMVTGPLAISGPIIADQTWSGDIELSGDVIVEAGQTLTLQPGTTVKARALVDDRLGGEDASRVELIVHGNLVTQGTGGSPVTLTSTRVVPERRDWYGVRFENSSDASLNDMAWTNIDAGWDGIEFRDTFAALDEVSSSNNYRYGLDLSSSTAAFPASATISGGSFLNNGSFGMYLYALHGTWTLGGVEIGDNDSYGLYVYTCNGDGPLTFDGVNVHHNASYGIYLYNCLRPLDLLGSSIDSNSGTGFYASYAQRTDVRATSFTNQTGTALWLNGPGELKLSKSTFSGNRQNVYVDGGSGPESIVFNEFGPWTDVNEPGVRFTGAASPARDLHFNNLREYATGAADIILSNAAAGGVNARVNYWDPDTTTEMHDNPYPSDISSIEDVDDNPAWGRVDWRANRASQVDLSPSQNCGFTSPVDGDLLTGVAFTLRGAAAADTGIQLVEISTDGGSTWNPVSTGAEVWTYDWTPPGSGNYDLACRVTDNDSMVQAAPTTINVDVNAASVTTSGTLTGDETWSGVVVLTGDVVVPTGITLTVDEGATVKATPQSDDRFSGVDSSRIELIIQGTLDLQGSPSLPVTFTSDRTAPAVPTAGDWYGIRLTDTADSAFPIHDAIIEAAVRGIWSYPGSHQDVIDCTVRDVTDDGIHMEFGSGVRDVADPGIEITGNTVERTGAGHYGIYLYRAGSQASWNDAVHQVSGNTMDDNGSYSIYVYASNAERTEAKNNVLSDAATGVLVQGSNTTSYTNRVEITGNQVTGATGEALYSLYSRDVLIDGNSVTGGGTGIHLYNVADGRVVNNTLSGGTSNGIFLSALSAKMTVLRNTVTGYGGNALVATGLSSLVALYNTFDGTTQDALQISPPNVNAVSRIHWNNIQGSATGYDFDLTTATGADAKRNYWDATNAEMIAEGYPAEISEIHDIADNAALGRVDYRGVETGPVTTAVSLESRFVWPFDGDSMSRSTITLEGTAYADPGVQLVEVSTDGGSTWLPATGKDFWTFSFTPVADGPQQFRCRVTDDDGNVEVIPDVISVTFDSALPTTEGTLAGNETWSGSSPILLTGDVIVPAGTTLTIDPGTTLLVQPLADNLHGGVDPSRIELVVQGTLDLQGTAMSPVTFRSSAPTPAAGDWYGIRLTDTADSTVTLHDLVVEYGVRGIWTSPGSHPDVVDCTVRHMTTDGIYIEFGGNPRDVSDPGIQISGNTVEHTGMYSYGIYLYRNGGLSSWNDAVHEVFGNTTNDTGSYAIYLSPNNAESTLVRDNTVSGTSIGIGVVGSNTTSYANRVELTGNHVSGATQQGLYPSYGRSVLIENNTVSGGGTGIYTYNVVAARIVNNALTGGTADGIYLTNNVPFSDITAHRNTISDYGDDGIFSGVRSLTALYNTISNSTGDAIEISSLESASAPQLHWNNIQGSGGYDTRLDTGIRADVRRNYWAGTNGEMLAEGYPAEISEIYDIADDTTRGRADYRGVEASPLSDAVSLESRFVWPFDGDTRNGSAITIEGTAYADAGVQLVEVSTDGGTSWLPASGADYWTFPFTPSVSGPQEIRCRVTDDYGMVETTPDVITVDFDLTLPTLEGTLPGNETWSGPGPYVLTGDVIIPAGTTLTIDPGTTIRVQPLADDRHGGLDGSRVELIVEGTLIAHGSAPGSIVMTSDSITPAKGHWYGIRYDGVPRPLAELRNVSLQWGRKGLSDSNSVGIPNLDGVSITQMREDGIRTTSAPAGVGVWTLRNLQVSLVDQAGLYLDTGSVNADVLLENVSIQDTAQYPLVATLDPTEDLTIRDSSFETASNYQSIYIDGPQDTLIERTTIRHPSPNGYAFDIASSHVGDNLTIDDSEITGGARSINIYRVTNATIGHSRITDGTIGVYLQGFGTSNVNAMLENNRITDTSSDGVYIGNLADATLHYNDLYNITGYALNNQSANDVDAAGNYWGEDTTTEMNAKGCNGNIDAIYDRNDNGSKGLVTYCGYATDPFGDQPTMYFYPGSGGAEIHWNPKADLTYDLIRGDLANLAVAGSNVDLGAVTCEMAADGSGVIPDTSPDPAAGQAWFFLLRDHTTPGTYGDDSTGRARLPASGDCP